MEKLIQWILSFIGHHSDSKSREDFEAGLSYKRVDFESLLEHWKSWADELKAETVELKAEIKVVRDELHIVRESERQCRQNQIAQEKRISHLELLLKAAGIGGIADAGAGV